VSGLSDASDALLAIAITALGTTVPDRHYSTNGQVALDGCDQLTVAAVGLSLVNPFGSRSPGPVRQAVIPSADFLVQIMRCAPSVQGTAFPDAATLQAAGDQGKADAEVLLCAFTTAMTTVGPAGQPGVLVPGYALSAVGQIVPYGPSGGVMGWSLPLTVLFDCS
jgi:hypothetical protein